MQLDDIGILVFGDRAYRGNCPVEAVEQVSFFNKLRKEYPDSYGLIAIHPRNEGQLIGKQFSSVIKRNAEGMTAGAADIIIPAKVSFVCELKRLDHTKSAWQDGQIEYLRAVQAAGGFACVALGAWAAWEALQSWIILHGNR